MILDGITFAERLKAAGVEVPDHTVCIRIEAVADDVVRVIYDTIAFDQLVPAAIDAALAAERAGNVTICPRPVEPVADLPPCRICGHNDLPHMNSSEEVEAHEKR
jgi:putative intracellular protease/amidase